MLQELCIRFGYCNTTDESVLADAANADEVVHAVAVAEGLDPETLDRHDRAALIEATDDWLFSSGGRGTQSGLPR